MVIESGLLEEHEDSYTLRGSLPPLAIPATLYDSLMARLDRLSSVKEIAQLGAVIGREFSYEALRAVCALEEDTPNEVCDLSRQVTLKWALRPKRPICLNTP